MDAQVSTIERLSSFQGPWSIEAYCSGVFTSEVSFQNLQSQFTKLFSFLQGGVTTCSLIRADLVHPTPRRAVVAVSAYASGWGARG